jgi:ribonuclease I
MHPFILSSLYILMTSLVKFQPIYTYYNLALKKCDSTSQWTLHGLWPDYNKKVWPQYCRNETINLKYLESYWDDLKKDWTSCEGDASDLILWSHEWNKHGTCVGMNQTQFFSTVLDLYTFVITAGLADTLCNQRHVRFYEWSDQCFIPFNLNFTQIKYEAQMVDCRVVPVKWGGG